MASPCLVGQRGLPACSTLRVLSSGRLRVPSLVESVRDREKRRRLLAEHVPRAYPGAVWTAKVPRDRDPLASSSVWITDLRGQPAPRLLVVIPFKDQVETTIKCLESIERQEHALDVLVVLVNNRSTEPTTRPRLLDWIG